MTVLRPSVILLVLLSITSNIEAQDRSYGRSVVATQYGMVATSQVSASQAGALILEQGGSAIDAAIAANAVLNVTEPTSNGMGGVDEGFVQRIFGAEKWIRRAFQNYLRQVLFFI